MKKQKKVKLVNQKEGHRFIVDCNNVAHVNKKTIDMDRLIKVLNEIKPYGNYLVFYSGRLSKIIKTNFFEKYPLLNQEEFIEVPNGEDADVYILEAAKKLESYIITIDKFREYKEIYPETIKRRIPFLFITSQSSLTAIIPALRSIH